METQYEQSEVKMKNTNSENEVIKNVSVVFTGRPVRDTVINGDDLVNLKIALETSSSLEEFLEKV